MQQWFLPQYCSGRQHREDEHFWFIHLQTKPEELEQTVSKEQDLCVHQCENLASRLNCGERNWEKDPATVSAVPGGKSATSKDTGFLQGALGRPRSTEIPAT